MKKAGLVRNIRRGGTRGRRRKYSYAIHLFSRKNPPHDLFYILLKITRHLAHVIQQEEFLLKLTRAMMMFGGPVHRLQSQVQSAGRMLDVELSLLYLPDVTLISFNDSSSGTSHIKLIRQGSEHVGYWETDGCVSSLLAGTYFSFCTSTFSFPTGPHRSSTTNSQYQTPPSTWTA